MFVGISFKPLCCWTFYICSELSFRPNTISQNWYNHSLNVVVTLLILCCCYFYSFEAGNCIRPLYFFSAFNEKIKNLIRESGKNIFFSFFISWDNFFSEFSNYPMRALGRRDTRASGNARAHLKHSGLSSYSSLTWTRNCSRQCHSTRDKKGWKFFMDT